MKSLRIVVCSVQVPFITGGAELHIESLVRELRERGHEVANINLPFQWSPHQELLKQAFLWRSLVIPDSGPRAVDLVIPTKYPTYLVRHPRKVTWLLHQFRQVYDLLTHELTDFGDSFEDHQIRRAIYELDQQYLRESLQIFTNSKTVAARLRTFNGLEGTPLYHPPVLKGRLHHSSWGNYILSVGRLELNKRVHLLVQAMKHVNQPIRARIIGEGPQLTNLVILAKKLGVEDRIDFLGRQNRDSLLNHYGNCRAVFYAPYDEDLGYVTMEAFLSKKPVVSCRDSGGVLEFLEPGQSGYAVAPEPEQLAEAINLLAADDALCSRMGDKGYSNVKDISWDSVIQTLLQV